MRTKTRPLKRMNRWEVALLIETSNAYARGVLSGVVQYIREHRPWSFHLMEQGRGDDPPRWLAQWPGDGIIARIETPRIAAAVRRANLPTIDLSAARLIPELPWVETDDEQIAKLAADHLLEKGLQQFAYCGDGRFKWSTLRELYFTRRIQAAGFDANVYSVDSTRFDASQQNRQLETWLKALPKPVGIMAAYDILGQRVLDLCRKADLAVPADVAVIGVDNDELLCDLSAPPLSSVIPNTRNTGYEAARLLDRMLHGEKPKHKAHLIAPLGIAARQSTDVLAIEDRTIAKALHFIRENACSGINVGDVLKAVPLSRSVLEERFNRLLRHTPKDEILRVRLDRVKQLLIETDLPLYLIAERTGFEHVEYLSVFFKREVGVTAREYRNAAHVKA